MFFVSSLMGLGACAQESGRSVMEIGSDLSNGERTCAKQKKGIGWGCRKARACWHPQPTVPRH